MSSYTIIENLSEELRRRVFAALTEAPDTVFTVTPTIEGITLSPPRDTIDGGPFLSLFLYHIENDGHLRNQRSLPMDTTGLRHLPFMLNLRYLITPLDEDELRNHLMLGRIVQSFHDQPTIDTIDGEPYDDSFGGAAAAVRLHFEPLSMEQLSHVWNALNTNYRLSVAYCLRVVAIDSARSVAAANRVTELQSVIGRRT